MFTRITESEDSLPPLDTPVVLIVQAFKSYVYEYNGSTVWDVYPYDTYNLAFGMRKARNNTDNGYYYEWHYETNNEKSVNAVVAWAPLK